MRTFLYREESEKIMNAVYSFFIAITMYSKIPMPTVEWTKERMRYVMCFFPVVGILQGIFLGAWFYVSLEVLNLSALTTALAGTGIPLLVTGGIHMDGFLDTMDALHSYGDRKKKLEILKDPHIGAFALISMAVYMLLYVAVIYEYTLLLEHCGRGMLSVLLMFIFVMERAFSGLSVVSFRPAREDGLAAGFAKASEKKREKAALVLWILVCPGILLFAGSRGLVGAGTMGVALTVVHILVFGWYYRMSKKEFGGVTGDLAGCFLQVCELCCFAAAVVLLKSGIAGGVWY